MSGEPALVAAARQICEHADGNGTQVRLLGGIAIWLRSPDELRATLGREYADIDLVTVRKSSKALREQLEQLGYVGDREFNALQGDRRLYFTASDGSYHVDVFVDKFEMSHKLDLAARIDREPVVLPAAELLLTKLQIAELNRKDAADTAMLLLGHELADSDGAGVLNVSRVAEVCSDDWGLFTTVSDNLGTTRTLLPEIVGDDGRQRLADERAAAILTAMEEAPKSRSWRRRAKIGRRMRWYETPDEV